VVSRWLTAILSSEYKAAHFVKIFSEVCMYNVGTCRTYIKHLIPDVVNCICINKI